MTFYWIGGEDIDFPNGTSVTVSTTAGQFRSGYARCGINGTGAGLYARSTTFAAQTSAWLSIRVINSASNTTASRFAAFGLSGGNKSLGFGTASAAGTKIALFKYDGSSRTELATESGNSLGSGTINRFEMQVQSYGASATVNLYMNGTLLITFSGDVTVSGMTNFDSVFLGNVNSNTMNYSEIVVADSDTRSFSGVATLALTGAGTTNNWTSTTFSNINGTTFSDTNPTSSNTAGQDNEYNVTDLPAGSFNVRAVKITMRAAVSATPTATQIKMGYNSGGSLGFGTGSTKTPGAAYGTFEQIDTTNPVTSAAWAQSEMNALQLEFQSV